MDQGLCVSSEHGRIERNSNRDLSKIEFFDFDPFKKDHVTALTAMIFQFYAENYHRDMGELLELTIDGKTISCLEAEAEIYRFTNDGAKILLSSIGGTFCGFIIYHLIYDCVLVIRAMYADSEMRKTGLGGLFIGQFPLVKKLIFSTYKKNPPSTMLSSIRGAKVFSEDEESLYWEAEWAKQQKT